ncbi:MAG: glycosyltransferase family 4 protein [Acidobacteriota bacterium]
MRIACDARPLLGPRTGVGTWLEGLIRGLAAATDWEFVLCLPRPVSGLGLEDLQGRCTVAAPPVAVSGTLWLTTLAGPLLADGADVFVGTLGILPRRLQPPAALALHDLTPRTRPGHHTLANRFCFNAYLEESVLRADELVCSSEATRASLAVVLPQPARRARVIPLAVDRFFSPPPDDEGPEATRARFAGGRPFVVQLGTLEPRKGIVTLLAAHARLLARSDVSVDLVLAGKQGWGGGWLERALAHHPQRDRVHLTGYVDRDGARALLRHAEVVVLASEEEGFGLPLVEALACGAACVASDAAALREVAAGAALHFSRADEKALAAALEAATEPARRVALRTAARMRVSELSWERAIAAWREVLARLRMAGDGSSRN